MENAPSETSWIRRRIWLVFLPLQAALLFHRIDLLPIWGDEQFTLNVITQPWGRIVDIVRNDTHPPLYYFLARAWIHLPWHGVLIEQVRAFSVLWALLSTLLIYRLWLQRAAFSTKVVFLALWTFSPVLVLYSRMARSYTLQVFAACLLFYAAMRFLHDPSNRKWMAAFVATAATTLYIHYVPGLAVVSATTAVYAVRWWRKRSTYRLRPMILALLATGVLYSPWLMVLWQTLQRTTERYVHPVAGNALVDAVARPAFWFVSFTFGEAFPVWAVVLGFVTGPVVLGIIVRSARARLKESPEWMALLALATVIAYIGTVLWVAVPFTPARLLFVLPFYFVLLARGLALHPRVTALALCGVSLVWLGALSSYFDREGFLNKGYLIPFSDMASQVERASKPEETLVLIDGYNTDPKPLMAQLAPRYRCLRIYSAETATTAKQAVAETTARTIWFFGNTNDISPHHLNEDLKAALRLRYNEIEQLFLPYSELDRFLLRLLGWRDPPTHHYQMLEFERRKEP